MGCYTPPSDASTIEDVIADIGDQPYEADLLVAGDLNANMVDPEVTPWSEAIADEPTVYGLMDMGLHLLPRCNQWLKYRCMWRMQQYGREV